MNIGYYTTNNQVKAKGGTVKICSEDITPGSYGEKRQYREKNLTVFGKAVQKETVVFELKENSKEKVRFKLSRKVFGNESVPHIKNVSNQQFPPHPIRKR